MEGTFEFCDLQVMPEIAVASLGSWVGQEKPGSSNQHCTPEGLSAWEPHSPSSAGLRAA